MDDLDNHIEELARFFWGEPTRQTSEELRWGRHGSKSLKGKFWYDHEAGIGGNVVQLIQEHIVDGHRPGAVAEFLKDYFGEDASSYVPQSHDLSALRKPDEPQRIVATYEYFDSRGDLNLRVHRMGPKKTFWQQLPDGRKPKDDPDFSPVPFRLPRILENPKNTVWVVEGEKDVLRLESLGLVATCNHGGAGSWTDAHSEWLTGRNVVILPDNDDAGRKHANKVAASLSGKAANIKIVDLAGLPEKGDVSDWLESGHDIDELRRIARATNAITKIQTKLPVLSMTEVMDMPPVDWLIGGLIPESSLSMIFGASGSGKTFLVLSMLCSVAHGTPWFDRSASKGCAVLVAGEGVGGLRKRLIAYHQEHGLEPNAPLLIVPRAVNLMDEGEVGDLIESIEAAAGGQNVKMIVIDTLARSMQGEADENSAQAMGTVVGQMDRLRTHFKAAVVPIHHTGKDNDRNRGGRGSSSLFGALDAAIFVGKHDDDLVEVCVQKQKDAEEALPIWFKSKQVEFQRDWCDEVETSIVLEKCEEKPDASKSKNLSEPQSRALKALTEAIIRSGRVPAGLGVGWPCVLEDEWRVTALDMTISKSGPDADRKAFARAAQSLVAKGLVEKRQGWVWSVEMALSRGKMSESGDF